MRSGSVKGVTTERDMEGSTSEGLNVQVSELGWVLMMVDCDDWAFAIARLFILTKRWFRVGACIFERFVRCWVGR